MKLNDNSPSVYRLDLTSALQANPLARALCRTTSLTDAENVARRLGIGSEIDYERDKTTRHADAAATSRDLDTAVRAYECEAAGRGVDYVTFRRIAEAIGRPSVDLATLRRHLIDTRPEHYAWPLWSLTARTLGLAR